MVTLHTNMNYTTGERNNAITRIAKGNADLNDVDLNERLESFNWISIKRLNGIINSIELTYSGRDLYRRLLKQNNV